MAQEHARLVDESWTYVLTRLMLDRCGGDIRLGRSTGTQEGNRTLGAQVDRKWKVATRHQQI